MWYVTCWASVCNFEMKDNPNYFGKGKPIPDPLPLWPLPHDTDLVWTVSQNEWEEGWETDSGVQGYGLTKATAQFLCDLANLSEWESNER